MKTRGFVLLLGLGILLPGLSAQEVFADYYGMTNYVNLPVIRIASVDDAADLAKKAGVKRAFVRWSVEDKLSSELLFQVQDGFYLVDLKGFRTVGDFRLGSKGGFVTGGDFYKAKALGIGEYDLFRYWSRNVFANLQDCKKAHAAGFVFDSPKGDMVILPLQMAKSSLDDFLKVIPGLKVYFVGVGGGPQGSTGQGTAPGSPSPGAPAQAGPQGQAPGQAQAPRFEGAYRLETSVYKLADPTKRVLKLYPANPGKLSLGEAQVYYLATANGLGKYEEYAALYEALANGYSSPKDLSEGQAKGFKNGAQYYAALQGGFGAYDDYALALDFGVTSLAAYKPLKDFWDKTTKIAQAEAKGFGEAGISAVLSLLPRGKPYPLATIVEFANKGILVNDKYRKLLADKGFQNSETAYLAFFRKYPELGSGVYDTDTGVFTRN